MTYPVRSRSSLVQVFLGRSRWREAIMEKVITCKKCISTFKVCGSYSVAKEIPHGITCPFCGEYNEVMWPMGTTIATNPKRQTRDKPSGLTS
jgi:hypothetical protein